MKKIITIAIILILCLIQTTAFALVVTDASNGGDKVSIVGDVKIDKVTAGSVVVVKGNADIQNNVNGDVVVVFGDVVINAKISGNVVAVLGTITLTPNAIIGGDLVSLGTLEKSEGAVIQGNNTVVDLGDFNVGNLNFSLLVIAKLVMLIIFIFFVIIFGLPILVIWNQRFKNISADIENRIGKKFTAGILGFILCFVLFILLGVTVVVPLAYFILAIVIELVVSIFMGKLILKLFDNNATIYVQFFLGFILLEFIKILFIFLIPVNGIIAGSMLSFGFDMLVNALGIGILFDSKFGKAIQ